MTFSQIQRYEKSAIKKPQIHHVEVYHHKKRFETVLKNIKQNKPHIILDLACGDGQFTKIIQNNGYNIIGIELSKIRAKRCHLAKIDVIIGDINYLPIKKESVDCITMMGIIEHLKSPEKTLNECWSVLVNNGNIILDYPSKTNILDMILIPIAFIFKSYFEKIRINMIEANLFNKIVLWGLLQEETHLYFYSQKDIIKIMNRYSLISIVGAVPVRYDFPNIIPCRISRIFDTILSKIPILSQFGAIQVVHSRKIIFQQVPTVVVSVEPIISSL